MSWLKVLWMRTLILTEHLFLDRKRALTFLYILSEPCKYTFYLLPVILFMAARARFIGLSQHSSHIHASHVAQ